MTIRTIDMDLAKDVFRVHGVDERDAAVCVSNSSATQ